jgi:hypothetical protein
MFSKAAALPVEMCGMAVIFSQATGDLHGPRPHTLSVVIDTSICQSVLGVDMIAICPNALQAYPQF